MKDKAYQYWLHCVPGIGDRTIERLLKLFGTESLVYAAKEKALSKVLSERQLEAFMKFRQENSPEKNYEMLCKKEIAFYTRENAEYPERLRQLAYPPYGLYCLGRMPREKMPAVAIVGARECSEYGSYVAKGFASELARCGVAVISGMARGIDGIGQRAALEAGGKTYAVLGCGVDICYPASNRLLYEEILEKEGGILSVFPPETKPQKQLFPERNRIVAGLSDLLLVVEARQKSGTWITVDMALEQGKSVYAVPGRLTDRLSDGCNMLIRQGAGIALSPEDLMAELEILGCNGKTEAGSRESRREGEKDRKETQREEKRKSRDMGAEEADLLLQYLDLTPVSADVIYRNLQEAGVQMELSKIMTYLVNLCLDGKADQVSGNYFIKRMQ